MIRLLDSTVELIDKYMNHDEHKSLLYIDYKENGRQL